MVSIIIVIILFLSKLMGQPLTYNLLLIPLIGYLFLSDSFSKLSKFNNIKIFTLLLISIFFVFLSIGAAGETIYFLFFRACSLTLFYLMLFGLIPFNIKLFEFFKYPLLLSLPALFFVHNPPFFYRYSASGSSFIGSNGLFNAFSVGGLFPTSIYMAVILTAFLLFYSSFPLITKKQLYIPFLSKNFNKFFLFILLLFTNRKSYLFAFIIYPLIGIFEAILKFINIKELNSKIIIRLIIILFVFFLGYFFLLNGVGSGEYDIVKIYNETISRINFYSKWAFSPDEFGFAETGIMMINKLGSYYLYLFTYFILVCSILISLLRFQFKNLRIFLLTYSFILLFLFKEPHTIFSPSPSSLLLFMILSFFMRKLHYQEKIMSFDNNHDE